MASPLVPGLSFFTDNSDARTPLPSAGQTLLLMDDLSSPADFLLHSAVVYQLKNVGDRVFILSSRDQAHWKTLSSKLGYNLSPHIQSGALKVFDPAKGLLRPSPNDARLADESTEPLKNIYHSIKEHLGLSKTEQNTTGLLILDDLALLEWSGTTGGDIVRFLRATQAFALENNICVVARYNLIASPPDPSPVLHHLMETCHAHVEVKSLSSGRSGAISGEISVNGGLLPVDPYFRHQRSQNNLYKLSSTGVEFFGRGTAGGML